MVEETVAVPNWSPKLDGFRVVAISDIHAGSNYAPEERIRYMVEQTNAQNADIVVLLGDYVSESKFDRNARSKPYGTDRTELRMPVATIADILGGLKTKHGVYSVIGNHDEYHNAPKITREFERVGIKALENQVAVIEVNGEKINLWGIEDLWKNHKVPVEAFDAIADKQNVIALTHNPDSLLRTAEGHLADVCRTFARRTAQLADFRADCGSKRQTLYGRPRDCRWKARVCHERCRHKRNSVSLSRAAGDRGGDNALGMKI